jgi:hypothetical protein
LQGFVTRWVAVFTCPASAATCMAAGFYATPTVNISTLAEVSPAE